VKIGVSSSGNNLEALVNPRFGRCPYFIIVDSESMQFEAITNVAANSGSGAGIQAAQAITSKQVQVMITGNVGPNAFKALTAAGIKIITDASGKVSETIEKYKKGLLSETKEPTVKGHFGIRAGDAKGRRQGQQ